MAFSLFDGVASRHPQPRFGTSRSKDTHFVTWVTDRPTTRAWTITNREDTWVVTTVGVTMNFEWDEQKRRANLRKHGFDFADISEMFSGSMLVAPDTGEDYGETR